LTDSWGVGIYEADHGAPQIIGLTDELERWLEPFLDALGHSTRGECVGLCGWADRPGDRKSVQPMAARDRRELRPASPFHRQQRLGYSPLEAALLVEAISWLAARMLVDHRRHRLPKKGHNRWRGTAIRSALARPLTVSRWFR